MITRCKMGLTAAAAGSLVAFATLPGQPASAQQLLFDWGGSGTVGGSGREMVAFSPKFAKGEIIVSFGDRKLYFITQPGQAISYPIAIPREQSRWQGVTNVSQKRVSPSWTPTPIMLAENPRLPRWVPGGHPLNPLGVRGLYLGSSMYRIHGTDAPWTIGTAVSKGCIRMYNQDVLDLYPRVNIGAKVTVTYQTFTTDGAVSKGPVPSKGMTGTTQSAGSTFPLFGGDEPPAKAAPKRPARTTKAKSAAVAPHPAATNTSATQAAAADKNPPVEKGPSDTSSAAAADRD
jgi:hypothetical protein